MFSFCSHPQGYGCAQGLDRIQSTLGFEWGVLNMSAVLLRLRLIVFVLLYLPFHGVSYGYDALNGDYYLSDKKFDDRPGWFVGVNMPRKSCLTYTFFEGDAMLMLGADHSRGDLTYFAMMAGKTWKYVGDKMYDVEVHYDGNLSWAGKGFGVEVSSYKGVTIENLTANEAGGFARGDSLSLVVNGKTQARFSLDGALDAVHRLVACAIEVEAGRVPLDPTPSIIPSLDARNHPEIVGAQAQKSPKPDVLPATPKAKIEPAPQATEEGREASSPAVRYDQGNTWYVSVDKGNRVCMIDVLLGEKSLFIDSLASSSSVPTYSLTFVDKFPAEKEEYFYELGGVWVFSSGTAKASTYKGRGYYKIDGLTDKFLNSVSQSDTLVVRFDAARYGEYDVKDFRRGLGRFSDCVREFGVAPPVEAREQPDETYDDGDDWSVFLNNSKRTCAITFDYGSRVIILHSRPPSERNSYYMSFALDDWIPIEEQYDLEIMNEKQAKVFVKSRTFKDDRSGYAMIDNLDEDFLDFITHSRVLRTKAKGIPPERYDLSGFGHAFQRFSDCLEAVRDRKSSSSPKIRRMN